MSFLNLFGAKLKSRPRTQDASDSIAVEGIRKRTGSRAQSRIRLTMILFVAVYCVIGGRLIQLGITEQAVAAIGPSGQPLALRPDILDRNGHLLATDVKVSSLFAEPRRIVDADEALEKLATVLPDLPFQTYYKRLTSDTGFVWLKRQISPAMESQIRQLGIPGINFRKEQKRYYPGGATAAHIVGITDIDNRGISGIENHVDSLGLLDLQKSGVMQSATLEPVPLSIDVRVQHAIRDEVARAMQLYQAKAAAAIVLNVKTGEVMGMASMPDFDPNEPVDAHKQDRLNRITAGVFEMGSTFKAFTTAMALDSGKVSLNDKFDARFPLRVAGHTINDFHAKKRWLTVPEVFIYSSNIGTAKMADVVGVEGHKEFLHRLGLLDPMKTELPESAIPSEPKTWKKINSITISYGHGVSTTPLQTAVAAAALVNGGKLIPPTFLPRTEEQAQQVATQVISPETSMAMRYLFRLNVEKGSGRRANVPGYNVGGKTGTAEKVVNGRYSNDAKFNAFLAAFPVDNPEFVVLTVVDEPQPTKGMTTATAGLNAAPLARAIIRRSAPFLGVHPRFEEESSVLLTRAR